MELNKTQKEAITLAISLIDSREYKRAKSLLNDILSGCTGVICEHKVESGCRDQRNKVGLCHPSHCPVAEDAADWARLNYGRKIPTDPAQVRNGFVVKIIS